MSIASFTRASRVQNIIRCFDECVAEEKQKYRSHNENVNDLAKLQTEHIKTICENANLPFQLAFDHFNNINRGMSGILPRIGDKLCNRLKDEFDTLFAIYGNSKRNEMYLFEALVGQDTSREVCWSIHGSVKSVNASLDELKEIFPDSLFDYSVDADGKEIRTLTFEFD